jgi:molecular chaperone HscB
MNQSHYRAPEVEHEDYFSWFGLSRRFLIDSNLLEQKYTELSRSFHPDRHVMASAAVKAEMLKKSADINDAYETLLSPVKRANYLLSLYGVNNKDIKADPETLMESLEWWEQLSSNEEAVFLQKFQQELEAKKSECIVALGAAFDKNNKNSAALLTAKLQYIDKALLEVRSKLFGLT